MRTPQVIIPTGYGLNCDEELQQAFRRVGAHADRVHLNDLFARKVSVRDYDIIGSPGGFSFKDDIYSGRVLANMIKAHLGDDISANLAEGKPFLGICNGCQSGSIMNLAPALNGYFSAPEVAFSYNESARFEDRGNIHLKTQPTGCVWAIGLDVIPHIPIASGEGRFVTDAETLRKMNDQNLVVFRYVTESGFAPYGSYPANPNGSMQDIAGITDPSGIVLLMMPHPERNLTPFHVTGWTLERSFAKRQGLPLPEPESLHILENGVKYARGL